jgi:hypothetical protein
MKAEGLRGECSGSMFGDTASGLVHFQVFRVLSLNGVEGVS